MFKGFSRERRGPVRVEGLLAVIKLSVRLLEMDDKGVLVFGNSKLEQVPESHRGLVKWELLGPTPHFLMQ